MALRKKKESNEIPAPPQRPKAPMEAEVPDVSQDLSFTNRMRHPLKTQAAATAKMHEDLQENRAKRDAKLGRLDNAHGKTLSLGDELMISEDGINGSVVFEAGGLNRVKRTVFGKTDREFLPYSSINHVAHDRAKLGRDQVTINISGKSFNWKVAKDAEGFVNTLNMILSHTHPEIGNTPHAGPVAQAAEPSMAQQIAELAELHASGILSDDEFAAAKAKLISG